jgi:hypothetical protein
MDLQVPQGNAVAPLGRRQAGERRRSRNEYVEILLLASRSVGTGVRSRARSGHVPTDAF